jgi:hypothetical protein
VVVVGWTVVVGVTVVVGLMVVVGAIVVVAGELIGTEHCEPCHPELHEQVPDAVVP